MPIPPTTPGDEFRLTPDIVVRQLRQLPSSPQVLPRLKRLLSDGNSSLFDVVTLIRLDQGIAAHVLQMGNSAYFSHGTRCYTVDEAVNRVGFDQVYQLVQNAVSAQLLVRPLAVYGLDAVELWRRSVTCALAAETLARHLRQDHDVAYTLGLFHAIGMVAIDDWAEMRQADLHFSPGTLPLETCPEERKALGFHNAEVGAALLRLWDFPQVVSEPLRWQYLPQSTVAHTRLASLLHVSKWLRTFVCTQNYSLTLPDNALLKAMNLTQAGLYFLAEETTKRLIEVNRLLEIGETAGTESTPPAFDKAAI
jgi:HD-like signal output (HDOD) protein